MSETETVDEINNKRITELDPNKDLQLITSLAVITSNRTLTKSDT